MTKLKVAWIFLLVGLLVVGSVTFSAAAKKTKLVILTHWSDYEVQGVFNKSGKLVAKGLKQYVEEYMQLHPEIEIKIQIVPFDEYMHTLITKHVAGEYADIYGLYSLWGVQLARSGILASPPDYIVQDVKANYLKLAVDGATIDGKIWGIPMEVDDYCLVYNKQLLHEAGYAEPPKTWDELVKMAVNLTKRNKEGKITQYGFAFLAGWDSAVVHPYLSLLYSLGGQPFSNDFRKCLLDSPKGIAALKAELELFQRGATDTAGSVWDFPHGTVAMMIMAPWYEKSLELALGDQYEKVVGVAPIPPLKNPANCAYTWFWGVDALSKHKDEAWKFLYWLTAEIQPATGTTRYGDLLAENIGAIPPRRVDFDNHPAQLHDLYTSVFIQELKHSIPEPNIAQGAEIKTIIMQEIVNAWNMRKTAEKALTDACRRIQPILNANYGS